jgi:hypothetical protein
MDNKNILVSYVFSGELCSNENSSLSTHKCSDKLIVNNESLIDTEDIDINRNANVGFSLYSGEHLCVDKELFSFEHKCSPENTEKKFDDNSEDSTIISNKLCLKEKSSIDNITNEGKIILKENDFFNDLDNLMNNNEFRNFYDKHFNDFTNTQIVLLYMKLYETLQIEYKEKNGCDIEKEVLAYIMKELMSDNKSRKNIIKAFNNYSENKNKNGNKRYLLDIFENKKNIIK